MGIWSHRIYIGSETFISLPIQFLFTYPSQKNPNMTDMKLENNKAVYTPMQLMCLVSYGLSFIFTLYLFTEFYAMPTHTHAYIYTSIWGRTCIFFFHLILYHIKSIHFPANFLTVFFFMVEWYMNVDLIFTVHSSVDEHLSWFHFLAAIANSSSVSMNWQSFQ